jgi:DNA-binding NtrC family response regulator
MEALANWKPRLRVSEGATIMERRKSVLVVEDEVLIGEMIGSALSDDGFDVHLSADAGDALRYLRSGNPVDVLFTDIDLPGEMDGGGLARCARELFPDLPVVYASGKTSGVRHVAKVPGSIFMQKPYDPFQASALVARMSEIEKKV